MPYDLASAEDVKCLLQDAMPSNVVLPTTTKQPGNNSKCLTLVSNKLVNYQK